MSTVRRSPLKSLLSLPILLAACGPGEGPGDTMTDGSGGESMSFKDPHSYSRPAEVVVTHLDLELDIDFEARVLEGVAVLSLDPRSDVVTEVVLDTWQLEIDAVEVDGAAVEFTLGPEDPLLGRSLSVPVTTASKALTVRYRTSPEARALQWLEPQQTLGGRRPFLFTQSQAILARTWIPLQDSPGVRFTWSATVRVPADLMAVMSAVNPTEQRRRTVSTRSRCRRPIPSYLMALAVGDLEFGEVGPVPGSTPSRGCSRPPLGSSPIPRR